MRCIVIWQAGGSRARIVCHAAAQGLQGLGYRVTIGEAQKYDGKPVGDIAISYGLKAPLKQLHRDFPAAGKTAVLIDLGYWGRHEGGRYAGFHRIAVNGLHPGAYFQRRRHSADRVGALNLPGPAPRREGRHILLAGMSEKAAWVYDLAPEEWERATVAALKAVTNRPIRYRPKPSWDGATRIDGTEWTDAGRPLAEQLVDCHAVVTHHSHVAIEALLAGIPVFVADGVSVPMSNGMDFARIESPSLPTASARDQWLADLAWTQWRTDEIREGAPWRHLIDEGVFPCA